VHGVSIPRPPALRRAVRLHRLSSPEVRPNPKEDVRTLGRTTKKETKSIMRKVLSVAAATGVAVLGAAAPAIAAGSSVAPGDLSLANIDASDAAQWQICGQNVLAQPGGQDCDNAGAEAGDSGVDAGALSLVNADASDAAHWQICGQEVGAQLPGQLCDNADA